MRISRFPAVRPAILALVLVTAMACGASEAPGREAPVQADPGGTPHAADGGTAAVTGDPTDPAIAVNPHEIDGVEVVLLDVRRGIGDTVTVQWQYRNRTQQPILLGHPGEAPELETIAAEAFLMDSLNGKKYLVVRDAEDRPLVRRSAGEGDNTPSLPPGGSLDISVTFPAPSGSVEALAVHIPDAAPFEDVPIQDER